MCSSFYASHYMLLIQSICLNISNLMHLIKCCSFSTYNPLHLIIYTSFYTSYYMHLGQRDTTEEVFKLEQQNVVIYFGSINPCSHNNIHLILWCTLLYDLCSMHLGIINKCISSMHAINCWQYWCQSAVHCSSNNWSYVQISVLSCTAWSKSISPIK